MHLYFFQCGGTIDKTYPTAETYHGYNFDITDPAVARILPRCHAGFSHTVGSILKKDSLDMNDEDRSLVFSTIQKCDGTKIILTHGTDTIKKTAEALSVIKEKTIVLTGAMLPEAFKESDADFNIGMAVAAVQTLPHGVYIALNGRVVEWQEFGK